MKIIIALGNYGEKYNNTRHNVGFMFFDFLIGKSFLWEYDKRFNADIAYKDNIYFIKPRTFVNNSGLSLRKFMDYYNLLPKKLGLFPKKNLDLTDILTVVHDDLDIDFGRYKISTNSSSAGHNGVKSIIAHLKTQNFKRVRIGINNEYRKKIATERFVLQRFSRDENIIIEKIFEEIKKDEI